MTAGAAMVRMRAGSRGAAKSQLLHSQRRASTLE